MHRVVHGKTLALEETLPLSWPEDELRTYEGAMMGGEKSYRESSNRQRPPSQTPALSLLAQHE